MSDQKRNETLLPVYASKTTTVQDIIKVPEAVFIEINPSFNKIIFETADSSNLASNTPTGDNLNVNKPGVDNLIRDPYFLKLKKKSKDELYDISKQKNGKKLVAFYKNQNEIIDLLLKPVDYRDIDEDKKLLKLKIAIYGSVVANIALFALQLVAAISSNSLSIFATMADAFMDILSSVVLVVSGYYGAKKYTTSYPTGKKRLETAGIIVFAVLMSAFSIQLIIESITRLISRSSDAEFSPLAVACVSVALLTKTILFAYCYSLKEYPAANVFSIDHRNDIMLNTFGILLSILGYLSSFLFKI